MDNIIDDEPEEEKKKDDDSSGEGDSSHGSMMVGGAVSKSDGDARLTKKVQNKIMRAASVVVRAMSDRGDAMDKAASSNFKTLEAEVKNMSGLDLYGHMSSNPSQMDKVSDPHIQTKMINDGYGKQLDVLTHGTYEAAQKTGRKDVMNALMAKPLSEMNPAEQSYVWDKLCELGQVNGDFDGNISSLESAIGSFVMSSPAGEQLVKEGRVSLSGGGDIKGPDPALKVTYENAVHNVTSKVTTVYHQVMKHTFKPGQGM